MKDIHVYFIRPVAPAPRYESSKLQNMLRNAAAGLPETSLLHELTDIMGWQAWL